MRLAVLANEELKEEFLAGGINDNCKIDWATSANELPLYSQSDAFIDLLFEQSGYGIFHLKNLNKPVIVNSVNKTADEIGLPLIRINAWPGFLKRTITEVACNDHQLRQQAENILASLNKKIEWIPDIKGFLAARVVAMIINEAYFALEENVSSKEEIDIAMKLGTNYPYGPFEWAQKIGLKNIACLLNELNLTEKRYQPAALLLKEAKA